MPQQTPSQTRSRHSWGCRDGDVAIVFRMFAKHVFYEGRVQGIGFRITVKSLATEFEVSGWVKNLSDGRVELQAISADDSELDAFLQEILDSRLAHHIKGVSTSSIAAPEGVRGFSIRD